MTPRHEIDLRNCYSPNGTREFDRNSVEGIRKSLSHCHDVNQALIRNQTELQRKLRNAYIQNSVLTAIITALAFKGLEIVFQAIR